MNNGNQLQKKFTVALPKTSFPMKGDLPVREPEIIEYWNSNHIKEKLREANEESPIFVMPDGPPYANGSIHIGHALNKTLKDIIMKYKSLQGYQSVFRPGWDCHGLPIEQAVGKKLGVQAKDKSPSEIRQLCRSEAAYWVEVQKEQFQRLGVMADWENPYLTMDPSYEAEEVREFARAFKKGVIYRGIKPVYWNWSIQTALAEAEVEYHPHKSPSIYVEFPVLGSDHLNKLGLSVKDKASYLVWTTTPWTLPANVALCINAEFEYGVYDCSSQGKFLVIAKNLAEAVQKQTEVQLFLKATIIGKDLEGFRTWHPFYEREAPIIFGEHVTEEAGTGSVHTAPGHGPDDYQVGLRYKLPVLSPVGPDGTFTEDVPEYQGVHILKANSLIIEKLSEMGRLFHLSQVEHSYPHCWRTKVPLMFRATPQWFIGLDLPDSKIREKTLKAIDTIQFFPEWGRARFKAMIENRPDWCLSRQRVWGVPIPVFICKKTGEHLAEYNIMMKVASAIENEGGIEAYHRHDPSYFIGDFKPQGEFGSQGFMHGQDILDVWFDSGICHAAVQAKTKGMSQVADIYLEGSDQHRGWFNTSMLTSMVTQGTPPFKALVTHGFIQQAKGVKMSKSKGGAVDPLEFCNTKGADILRLWCSHEDYGKDIIWGDDLIERVTETYRRLRNTFRFLLGTLDDLDLSKELVHYEQLTPYDRWALHRLNQLILDVTRAYEEYSFYKVYHLVNQYVTVDLSALYLDILKDRLYTFKLDHPDRKSGQTVIYYILKNLNGLIAPILSFLAEEVYQHRKDKKSGGSIFLEGFPKPQNQWNNPLIAEEIAILFDLREIVQKQLEDMRAQKVIGSSLEAQVKISVPSDKLGILKKWTQFREILIVSGLSIEEGDVKVISQRAMGEKCPRCWIYSSVLNQHSGVCPKCHEAL